MGYIGSSLRIAQALLYLVTLASGITCCICMGVTSKLLNDQCVLYAKTVFYPPQNNTLKLDLALTSWGSGNVCSYCTFSAVMAVIYAIIWFWFYILMSDWKEGFSGLRLQHYFLAIEDGPPPDVKLLIPTLICNLIMFCCMTVNAILLTDGFSKWCDSIESQFSGQDCSVLETYTWSFNDSNPKIYSFLREAYVACWITLVALGSKIILVSIRLRRYVTSVKRLEKLVGKFPKEAITESMLKTISEESDDSDEDEMPRLTI
ncbi:hypothetical protein CAPTEDRAFT_198692 [Capitella teleta]|uniref:Uncharacterized protein n=1 Tax=Capitella teleta TaxID=283909 RepID=R7V320_CAPTE|nr:hypothetical protein CAPTEDRAFT_198692 [Capitella teleta]|eukprot:ELU12892.1 hypothetical protein CAPTEDRAFT_198692 [Capitella teleta]